MHNSEQKKVHILRKIHNTERIHNCMVASGIPYFRRYGRHVSHVGFRTVDHLRLRSGVVNKPNKPNKAYLVTKDERVLCGECEERLESRKHKRL